MDDASTNPEREAESGGAGLPGSGLPGAGLPVRLSPYLLALGSEAVAQVVHRFLTNVADMEREMRHAVEGKDAASLERAAHSLKGSSGTIGAGRLRQICRRLEDGAEKGTVDGAQDGLEELRREARRIRRQLCQHLGDRDGP